jgi:ATP-dependent DNA helicase RecQ
VCEKKKRLVGRQCITSAHALEVLPECAQLAFVTLQLSICSGFILITHYLSLTTKTFAMDDDQLLYACQQKMATTALRPGQGDVIRHLQNKKSCLAVMPTGGGKSLLWLLTTHILNLQFRADACHKPLTLVIVPYKALVMSHLRDSHTWFSCLSSENDVADIAQNIDACCLIYSTPEKIVKNLAFQQILSQNANRIRIIAIDEAHLLLEHASFRPDFCACISLLQRQIPRAVRLAVSATSRIADSGLLLAAAQMPSDSSIVRCSLDRSNCFISIAPQLDKKDKFKVTTFTRDHISIFQLVNKATAPQAIIFVCSRREAENLARSLQSLCSSTFLQENGIVFFHAELTAVTKQKIMTEFASQQIQVVVATSAFGTGVNFPSIRYIIHYTLPSSLTEYMQNIGRGGRDGLEYHCVLYFSYKNIHEQGSTWMYGTTVAELPQKWQKFVEMIQFVFSTKCL